MQILTPDTESELKTDTGIDTMQSFIKLEFGKVAAFKPLLMSGVFFCNIPKPYGLGSCIMNS